MKILTLSVYKQPFDVMVTGEKRIEFRRDSEWIQSRLHNGYSHVRFVNGYGKDKPYFIVELRSYVLKKVLKKVIFSNGFTIEATMEPVFWILLGEIVEAGNLKTKHTHIDLVIHQFFTPTHIFEDGEVIKGIVHEGIAERDSNYYYRGQRFQTTLVKELGSYIKIKK